MTDQEQGVVREKPFVFPADRLVRINAAREAASAAGVAAARAAGRNPRSVRIDIIKEVLVAVPDASAKEIAASLIWNAERMKQEARKRRRRLARLRREWRKKEAER
jgi:hypothetical protein